jgi:methionyl-tRNA synthetase
MGRYFLTTSIAYINGEPHIGYGQEVLAADVVARLHRLKGEETFYLTGSDEHGFSVEMNAKKAGMKPDEFVETLLPKFLSLKEQLNLSYDYFVRTTDPKHQENAKEIWKKAYENGWIEKRHYSGVYCVGCEAMKNRSELVNGKCPNHPNIELQDVEEENWFFKLSAFREKLLVLYKKNPTFVEPDEKFNEIKSLVEAGLDDVSISRPKEKLAWGIEVPNDPDQVMYVWFDALTNYLYPEEQWPADLHIIGKDILRFHAALWPAMLLAAGYSEDELPKKIFVHGFISVEGQKMSKTLGNVIKPQDLIDEYGQEATRYLLLRELNFAQDSDFSWERMTQRYNADLANDLGNLLQRTLTMIKKYEVKTNKGDYSKECDYELINTKTESLKFSDALTDIWKIIQASNKLIDDSKPWELAKKNHEELERVINIIYRKLWCIGDLIKPYMPITSGKIIKQLETMEIEALFPRIT